MGHGAIAFRTAEREKDKVYSCFQMLFPVFPLQHQYIKNKRINPATMPATVPNGKTTLNFQINGNKTGKNYP